ncbi:Small glutamine-rich tetratricopeptide repeat-containing protein 2 [Yarrowia sp. C11]|nr:Small glutamine-rich tetratricopeptide repeat-containing protein 2 [Yarrowia sp. E02]KAG5373387.1 Small glutamine-rich tetratricopeptide repeat-containing protein 2 [Yarrowia sp. C11]
MSDKKDLAVGIVDFLKTSVADGTIAEDDHDSVQVAIDCLEDVFKIEGVSKDSVLGKQTLLEIFKNRSSSASAAASSDPKVEAAAAKMAAATAVLTEEQKAQADKLKLEGNKALSQRNFEESVDLYTQAIDIDANNAVYYSNRAAAYSQLQLHDNAIADADAAIRVDPNYSKAYSRLGLAKYASGDAQGALEAYEMGMKVEGDNVSDAMKRGYETAKKRVDEEAVTTRDAPADGAGAGGAPAGFPDLGALGSMFGGGAGGGMPDLAGLMNNPAVAQMAQKFMSDPNALSNLMSNPAVANMAQRMQGGNMPSMSEMMNDPALREMASKFGGAGGAGGAGGQ